MEAQCAVRVGVGGADTARESGRVTDRSRIKCHHKRGFGNVNTLERHGPQLHLKPLYPGHYLSVHCCKSDPILVSRGRTLTRQARESGLARLRGTYCQH